MKNFLLFIFSILAFSSTAIADDADENVLRLYIDSDWSNNYESAESIWRGINVALDERNFIINGYKIEVVKKDHRGNILRSLQNYKSFLKDDKALAIIGGKHSPPYIKNRTFINEHKALTLVAWAAGAPVTRYPSAENWVFRLSVDDTKAGQVLVNHALDEKKCKTPHLIIENTPWGDSNVVNMTKALQAQRGEDPVTVRFEKNIKDYSINSIVFSTIEQGADCIIFVGGSIEGSKFSNAVLNLKESKKIPIISHWGISGGNFTTIIDAEKRKHLDLSFIQSCFSFHTTPLSPRGQAVLKRAQTLLPDEIKTAHDISAPGGFIHAYDLSQVLFAAMEQITIDPDIAITRNRIRLALEDLNVEVEGLLKTYNKPFSVYSKDNNDAHEALGLNDFCMAKFDEHDQIIVTLKQ